jgi:hypothetical protein
LQMWQEDFFISSCSFAFNCPETKKVKTLFTIGEAQTKEGLKYFLKEGFGFIAHNLQYDLGCFLSRFPELETPKVLIDTKRLAQLVDNGVIKGYSTSSIEELAARLSGEDTEELEKKNHYPLSLVGCANRFLPKKYHNFKEETHKLLREKYGVKKGTEGSNLDKLNEKELAVYNNLDSIVTLKLYEALVKKLGDFNWNFDHNLHVESILYIYGFYSKGVKVNRTRLAQGIRNKQATLDKIENRFRELAKEKIDEINEEKKQAFITALKTQRGNNKRLEYYNNLTEEEKREKRLAFKITSLKDLRTLFIDKLGFTPKFYTKAAKNRTAKTEFIPSPSLSKNHLHQYGEYGKILETYTPTKFIKKQLDNLAILAKEGKGFWHWNLNACGTKTSRFSGSSDNLDYKLNCQGLARKDPDLMRCLVPHNSDYVFASVDLTAGEPTVTAHYSQDLLFKLFNFGMVGKAPYYNNEGVLVLDDIYLGCGSVFPSFKKMFKELYHTTFKGLSFSELWLEDKDVIKTMLKKERNQLKTLALAIQYGQRPRGMTAFAYDNGIPLAYQEAKEFYQAYWYTLFPKVRVLKENLETRVKKQGFIVNEFGYRLVPQYPKDSLNMLIQSSVSGVMKLLLKYLFEKNPLELLPMPIIHDEVLLNVPKKNKGKLKEELDYCLARLDKTLNWSLPIRTGCVFGNDLYEAK